MSSDSYNRRIELLQVKLANAQIDEAALRTQVAMLTRELAQAKEDLAQLVAKLTTIVQGEDAGQIVRDIIGLLYVQQIYRGSAFKLEPK